MIERRSRLAFDGYRHSLEAGNSVDHAIRVADRILFRGLLFSPYDTVHLILETDFPAIPQNQRQTVALKLTRICASIFERTPLGDDFAQQPEFRILKERLRRAIRRWIDENGVPGYQSPERPAFLENHFK